MRPLPNRYKDNNMPIQLQAKNPEVLCEHCSQRAPLEEGYLACNPRTGDWIWQCSSCNEGWYDLRAELFFGNPAEWLEHLSDKRWFDPLQFREFLERIGAMELH